MPYGARILSELRSLLIATQEQRNMEGENILTSAATINGWVNIGFGLPAMFLTAMVCWIVSGIVVLTLVGWDLGTFDAWTGGAPVGHPECYLRTDLWNYVCAVASVIVGLRTGANIRRRIKDTDEADLAQLHISFLPRVGRVCSAILFTSFLAYVTAAVFHLPESYSRTCTSIAIQNRF